ncbi:MAG TPA: RIO1 family regulatory kinase/ATPase [Arthrobacter sp.]|nr:RIO1 family regulatory kinase/ATPase [Arthrobacter sp.]
MTSRIDLDAADTPDTFQPRQHRPSRAAQARPADWNALDDDLAADQRWSTWPGIEKSMRGPLPYPEFVIEDAGAVDTELGVLKTGKEADVFLIERATAGRRSILAAKRYRPPDQRAFHRSTIYTEGRTIRRTRDARALKNGSTYGRQVEATQWAAAEWSYLVQAHDAGIPVPYPVQIDGTEILMEFIEDPDRAGSAAPRLHQMRPDQTLLDSYYTQLIEAMRGFAALGYAHGDLSPYNILAAGPRLVVIDLPQLVDLAINPLGADLLARDCRNVCTWFAARGIDQDPEELLGELLAAAWP